MRRWLYQMHWRIRSRSPDVGLTDAIALLDESQRWPRDRLVELREGKLRRLVAHAYDQIPGYRRMMDERSVKPGDIRSVADLPKLPIMTKDILREHWSELRARDIPDRDTEVGSTGGTTGVPMKVARDLVGTVWQRAAYWRGFSWGGLTLGTSRIALFGGSLGVGAERRVDQLKAWFAGKVFLPAFELGPHNIAEYADAIRRSGARFMVAYTSACYLMATLAEKARIPISFDAVYPTAEILPPDWAETIARVFGAKVLPYYGSGEVQSLGYFCPEGAVYHTCDEHAVIEVEPADGAAAAEGAGAFLLTDLDNLAMPMIRYRNGDAGRIAGPGCRCGRSLGRIVELQGRVNDVLITTRGVRISGAIAPHAFRLIANVDSYQIIQRAPGQATVRIVHTAGYDLPTEERKLKQIFETHLGEGSAVDFEYVSSIPRTAAGKARFVINEYLTTNTGPSTVVDSAVVADRRS